MKNKPRIYLNISLFLCLTSISTFGDLTLLIGDSISMGYNSYAQAYAGGRHELIHTGLNSTSTESGILHINEWLNTPNGGRSWDIIHFNFGLHDISRTVPEQTNVSIADYKSNLQNILSSIVAHSPDATLIFALTTPVLPINSGNRIPEDVSIFNNAAMETLGSNVFITDLYSPMLPHLNDWSTDGTHFTAEGNQFNGQNVVDGIDAVIPEPASIALFITHISHLKNTLYLSDINCASCCGGVY